VRLGAEQVLGEAGGVVGAAPSGDEEIVDLPEPRGRLLGGAGAGRGALSQRGALSEDLAFEPGGGWAWWLHSLFTRPGFAPL